MTLEEYLWTGKIGAFKMWGHAPPAAGSAASVLGVSIWMIWSLLMQTYFICCYFFSFVLVN